MHFHVENPRWRTTSCQDRGEWVETASGAVGPTRAGGQRVEGDLSCAARVKLAVEASSLAVRSRTAGVGEWSSVSSGSGAWESSAHPLARLHRDGTQRSRRPTRHHRGRIPAPLQCRGFQPHFVTYRMRATHDSHMSRVTTAWSISSMTFQPLFILAGGVLAAATSTRFAIMSAAVLLLCSGLLLPWRTGWPDPATQSK